MDIGKSTTKCLEDKNKSTQWLADQLGVSVAYAHTLKKSRHAGSRNIERLAKVFGKGESEFVALGE